MVETLKYDGLSTNVVINPPERKIIRSYAEREKPQAQVSFAKSSQENSSEEQARDTTEEAPLTRTERAAQFRHARDVEKRAMQLKKQAEQQFDQARGFQQLMQEARKDPTVIAKAMGMEPNEFLRQYQNQMFNIKDEPEVTLKPEEEVKQRLDRYEAERIQERKLNQEIQSQTIKQTWVTTKILPVLDEEEFELIHLQGSKEEIGGFIYDIMNDHYCKTGEELDPKEVAEEMERVLLADYESKVQGVRKAKKLSKYFVPEESAQLGAGPGRNEVKAKPAQLGSRTLSSRLENPNLSTGEPTRAAFMSREERINKILSKY